MAGLEQRLADAVAAAQKVYDMDTTPVYYLPKTKYEKLVGIKHDYAPTILDTPVLWPQTGGRKEVMKSTLNDYVAQVKEEEDTADREWKESMKVAEFTNRANQFAATDWLTHGYPHKVRFTECRMTTKHKEAFSFFSSVPFSGTDYDPLRFYVSPKDLPHESIHEMQENAYLYKQYGEVCKGVIFLKVKRASFQLFTDNNNPTVYQIFKDLGLPHPSIPWSKWSTFLKKSPTEQAALTRRLENEVLDVNRLL